jgi:hypothetical protein
LGKNKKDNKKKGTIRKKRKQDDKGKNLKFQVLINSEGKNKGKNECVRGKNFGISF